MAAVPVGISGILYDKKNKTSQQVYLIGLSHNPKLSIGGGPVIPEAPPEVTPPDLGFWGGSGVGDYIDHSLPEPERKPPFTAEVVWSEENGWAVVLVPTGEHVTPSKRR